MTFQIVPVEAEHKPAIRTLLMQTDFFRADEIEVAMELIDDTLARQGRLSAEDYHIFVAIQACEVLGYVCFGKTPMTDSTFDLYWIAVAPHWQSQGIGRQLFEFACEDIRKQGGTLLVIETSSQPKYEPTCKFYEKVGCTLEARIKNFYRLGDDKLIYTKPL